MAVAELEYTIPEYLTKLWTLPFPPPPILCREDVKVTLTRIPNLADAFVPVSLLNIGELPVDELQMQLLEQDFELQIALGHENGQRDAIGAATLEDDDENIEIHDGYHRSNLLARRHAERAYASLTVNCTPDELISLRTLAATPHEMVKPPRMVLVGDKKWERTPWGQRGVKMTQAYQLVVNSHNSTGSKWFESPEDAAGAAEYIRDFCRQWGVRELDAYGYKLTADVADRKLFFSIQGRRSGDRLNALTYDHVRAIARRPYGRKSFANRFEEQRLVADVVLEMGLNLANTRILMNTVIGAEDSDHVRRIIEEGAWKTDLRLTRRKNKKRVLQSEDGLAVQLAEALMRAQTAEGERDSVAARIAELETALATPRDEELSKAIFARNALYTENKLLVQQFVAVQLEAEGAKRQLETAARQRDELTTEISGLRHTIASGTNTVVERRLQDAQGVLAQRDAEIARLKGTQGDTRLVEENQALRARIAELSRAVQSRGRTVVVEGSKRPINADDTFDQTISLAQQLLRNPLSKAAYPTPRPIPVDRLAPPFNIIGVLETDLERKMNASPQQTISAEGMNQIAVLNRQFVVDLADRFEARLLSTHTKAPERVVIADLAEQAMLLTLAEVVGNNLSYKGLVQFEYWMLRALRWHNHSLSGNTQTIIDDPKFETYMEAVKGALPYLDIRHRLVFILKEYLNQPEPAIANTTGQTIEEMREKLSEARRRIALKLIGIEL